MVDAQGLIGWAPASYLVPVNETEDEEQENKELIEQERGEEVNSDMLHREMPGSE